MCFKYVFKWIKALNINTWGYFFSDFIGDSNCFVLILYKKFILYFFNTKFNKFEKNKNCSNCVSIFKV